MKKTTLFIALMTFSFGFSQQQQYNFGFEPGSADGVVTNWFTFDNGAPAAEIVTNPDPDGTNTSATTKVLKVVMGPGNAFYAGVNNKWQDRAFGTWKLDAAVPNNLTVTIDVNKNYVGTVGIQMITNTGATTFGIVDQNVGNAVVDQWQTLTWTIPTPLTNATDIAAFTVFVDWTQGGPDRAEGSTIYIDNIRFNAEKLTDVPTCSDGIQNGGETGVDCGGTACAPCAGQDPLVAAPTPPARNAADVVSIFSGAYANVTLSELPTAWSQLTSFTPLQIAGDDTWKVLGCDFIGIVTNYTTGVDLSTMENMHIDYWTPSANPISVKIVNTVNAPVTESTAPLGPVVTGSWQSIDVPMTAFVGGLVDKTKITQLLIDPTAPSTLFIDNFYFYKGLPLSTHTFEASNVKLYPNPATNVLNIESAMTIEKVSVYNLLGQEVISKTQSAEHVTLDVASLQVGVYVVKTSINGNVSSTRFIKE